MKCKSWSNKINNFVVRRLKSIKINSTQQPQQSTAATVNSSPTVAAVAAVSAGAAAATTTTTPIKSTTTSSAATTTTQTPTPTPLATSNNSQQQQQQQQQYQQQLLQESTQQFHTMPAMPKEKTATAVSAINETNFADLKFKELAVVAAMATTAATTMSAANSRLHHNAAQHQHSTCGCGAVSAAFSVAAAAATTASTTSLDSCGSSNSITLSNNSINNINNNNINNSNRNIMGSSSKYLTNGHTSPLAAAVAAQQQSAYKNASATATTTTTSATTPMRNNRLCCRSTQYQNGGGGGGGGGGGLITTAATTTASTPATATPTMYQLQHQQQQQLKHQHQQHHHHQQQQQQQRQQQLQQREREQQLQMLQPQHSRSSSSSLTADTAAGAATAASQAAAAAAPAPVTPPRRSANDFIFGRYIGEGSFSMVYLASDVHTRKEYAIKVCEKRHILREHKQEYIRREREVMHQMTTVPGFVNLSCTFQDARSLYFVMTYAKQGDLLPYINKVGSFDADCTRHYAAELLLACEQMHRRNIVHRDLKPENILLDEDMHTLIADFGSAKIMTPKESAQAAAWLAGQGGARVRADSARTSDEDEDAVGFHSVYDDADIDDNDDDDEDDDVDEEDEEDDNVVDEDDEAEQAESDEVDTAGSDEVDAAPRQHLRQQSGTQRRHRQRQLLRQQQRRYQRRRKNSFVGTAQYVSPEVLQNGMITPAADLWALGCIVYQMIAGLPPFRGSNDYVIFREILACTVDFPEGFDPEAEDLVRRLLKVNPQERLGAQDSFGCYESIRAHPFFARVDWSCLREQTPPQIYPYLPGVCKDEEFRSRYRMPENLEPGLTERQISRLLGIELGVPSVCSGSTGSSTSQHSVGGDTFSMSSSSSSSTLIKKKTAKNSFDLSAAERMKRLEQQKSDKWHVFADGEVILKKGFVNKRKGLFARKRMLLLTTGPRLIYIDPVQMIKKGEIAWSPELRIEAKNFKIFFVHTPNRTYYLDDPEGYSLEWVDAIEKMRALTYFDKQQQQKHSLQQLQQTTTPASSTNSSQNSLSTSPSAARNMLSAAAYAATASTSKSRLTSATYHKTSSN